MLDLNRFYRLFERGPFHVLLLDSKDRITESLCMRDALERMTNFWHIMVPIEKKHGERDIGLNHTLYDLWIEDPGKAESGWIFLGKGISGPVEDHVYEVRALPDMDSAGRVHGTQIIMYEIAEREKLRASVHHMATHDPLTDLPNWTSFYDRLIEMMSLSDEEHLMLMLVDIDRFKRVNESLGHRYGDIILQSFSRRLEMTLPSEAFIARLGGDRFGVLMRGRFNGEHTEQRQYERVARQILESLGSPFTIHDSDVYISTSIGISVYPDDGENIQELMKNAESAAVKAKQLGGSRYQMYNEELNARSREELEMESRLRRALDKKEMVVFLQPQVDIRTGRIVGAEALLRWQYSPERMVSPDRFISMAEDIGIIDKIGEYVLSSVCEIVNQCKAMGVGPFRFGVNISVFHFEKPDFFQRVCKVIEDFKVEPKWIELEITESIYFQTSRRIRALLRRIREYGLWLALDDFGTGYSSLSYLMEIPITTLKIDKSFVQDMMRKPAVKAITRSIIQMAHDLKLHVIAEGIESEQEHFFLLDHQCDTGQGYYYGKPMPLDRFLSLIR